MKDGGTKDGVEGLHRNRPICTDEFVTDEYAIFKGKPELLG